MRKDKFTRLATSLLNKEGRVNAPESAWHDAQVRVISFNAHRQQLYCEVYKPGDIDRSTVFFFPNQLVIKELLPCEEANDCEADSVDPTFPPKNNSETTYTASKVAGKQLALFDKWHDALETEPYENDQGGRQTALLTRMDLMPPMAATEIGKILKTGAEKYGEHNWMRIPWPEQLNHALVHLFKVMDIFRRIELTDDEVEKAQLYERMILEAGQAGCRTMFFLDMLLRERLPN